MSDYSVINLLKEYQINKSKLKMIGYKGKENDHDLLTLKEKMELLDFCITCLPDEEKEIISNIYVKNLSERKIAKVMIMSRSAVASRREKAIKILEKLFIS